MFKYPIFQTVLRNSFSYSHLLGNYPVKSMDSWFAWGSRVNCYHPKLFISVSDGGLLQPGLRSSECRDERIIFMTPESSASQEVWGLMIFVPPSPGLFLLLLMFRNCEQPGAPRLLPPRSPGTEEEQPPSREILDQHRDQAAWDWADWNAILSYLTQHWLHFFLSWVLAEQRGKFAIFYPSQHSTDK